MHKDQSGEPECLGSTVDVFLADGPIVSPALEVHLAVADIGDGNESNCRIEKQSQTRPNQTMQRTTS